MLNNTQDVIYLEDLNFANYTTNDGVVIDNFMDSQIITISDDTGLITGLDHLAGQMAFVFANGFPDKEYYVELDGTLTIPTKNAIVVIGLDYTPELVTMPLVAFLQNGISVYEPTKIDYMYVDYYKSLGITVQGQNIPQISPGSFMTQAIPIAITDYYKIPAFGGWDPRVQVEISQSYPAPMTILAVSYTIEVSP